MPLLKTSGSKHARLSVTASCTVDDSSTLFCNVTKFPYNAAPGACQLNKLQINPLQ